MRAVLAVLLAAFALPRTTAADEGMWTFNGFPSALVKGKYGFEPGAWWLERARLSSARLAQGCSASFVSGNGLLMTNHHCAHRCIEELSTPLKNLVREGFYAATAGDEVRCPDLEVDDLVHISDVTARMLAATRGLEGRAFAEARRAETARIEKECQTSDQLRCEVVTLYHGGRYDLYRYRRFQDVRLVFAPEFAIAFFGGDPDNFNFPRWDLDVTFLRVYQDGRPVKTPDHFGWSPSGPVDGELTFVSGNPGRTSRQLTVAQLVDQRDTVLPETLFRLHELRGLLTEYQRRGPEEARHSTALLFYTENSVKALRGRLDALRNPAFFQAKVAEEEELKATLARDPDRARRYLPAFDAVARAVAAAGEIRVPLRFLEQGWGFGGDLFGFARTLVRAADELPKPNGKRLREYRDSALPALTQKLFSPAPVFDELEILRLGLSLSKLREAFGADDPLVRRVLGQASPDEEAARLVAGTRLEDVAYRRALWKGGKAAVEAAARTDPMIEMAMRVDPDARAIRARYEDDIEAAFRRAGELLARARFDIHGTGVYPDATFTARLSYGRVKGWQEDGRVVPPFTSFAGAFARATGRDPFVLPQSWLAARPKLDLSTPFDFVTDNDIIGGNSGSPVFDKDLRIVGLVFDGNIHSLGGEYAFDDGTNRTVAVDSRAIVEALRKIYRADRIADELGGK